MGDVSRTCINCQSWVSCDIVGDVYGGERETRVCKVHRYKTQSFGSCPHFVSHQDCLKNLIYTVLADVIITARKTLKPDEHNIDICLSDLFRVDSAGLAHIKAYQESLSHSTVKDFVDEFFRIAREENLISGGWQGGRYGGSESIGPDINQFGITLLLAWKDDK